MKPESMPILPISTPRLHVTHPLSLADPHSGGTRVMAIDGLRGIAALLVVFYHLDAAIVRSAGDWAWSPVEWVFRNGYLGVDIFFVISGYVIALSVSKGVPTLTYFGRFIVRRSIRLDPPYWAAIALEIALIFATLKLFPSHTTSVPSWPQVLSHLIYAQEILGYGSIVPIFWTLCMEVQFYAFYVGLRVLRAHLPKQVRRPTWTILVCAGLFGISLYTRFWPPTNYPNGLAINRWFQFFIGVLTWIASTDPKRVWGLLAAWVALLCSVLLAGTVAVQLLPIGVSALIVGAVRYPRLGSFLTVRPLQFLGVISYSLYLYHSSVGWRFVSLMQELAPGHWGSWLALAVFLSGVAGSIVFATFLWWLIERPFLQLSRRIKLPTQNSVAQVNAKD